MSTESPLSPGHRHFLELQAARVRELRGFMEQQFCEKNPLTLEIGCGHGHYLTAYAQENPNKPCLGIDMVSKRIRKACQKRDKRDLTQLHFLKAEVRELFMAWPSQLKIERTFILFPDPWPKKRHAKNRIIQAGLLDNLAAHAISGATLHFRTDHRANFEWGSEQIGEHRQWQIQEAAPWPFESPSFFQDLLGAAFSLSAVFTG